MIISFILFSGQKAFPDNLDCVMCSRDEIAEFGRQCVQLGVQYMGICCGNNAGFTRALSESISRLPPASRFRPDMSKYVSDLHRRLIYLQKVKEMEEEQSRVGVDDEEKEQVGVNGRDEKEELAVNGKDQKEEGDEEKEQVGVNGRDEKEEPAVNGKDQKEEGDVNGEEQRLDDKDTRAEPIETDNDAAEVIGDQQESSEIPQQNVSEPPSEPKEEEAQREGKEESMISINGKNGDIDLGTTRRVSNETSTGAFTIRLPPPPDSKRNRSSPSPTTSENNESEIRLPPPPGSDVKRKDSRSRRRHVSSSSSDDDNEKEVRLPPPPGSSSPRLSSGRRSTGSRSPASGSHSPAIEESNEPQIPADVSKDSEKLAVKASIQNGVTSNTDNTRFTSPSESQQISTTEAQPTQHVAEKVVDSIATMATEDAITLESKPGNQQHIASEEGNLLVDVGVEDSRTHDTANESQELSINVVAEVPQKKETSEWASFLKSQAEDTSSVSSADEDQMAYTRLEKQDHEGGVKEETQLGWATFTPSTATEKEKPENISELQDNVEASSNWADFQSSKPADGPSSSSSNNWANFDTLQETDGAIENITTSRSLETESGDLICIAGAVEADSEKPHGTVNIDFGDEYEDSEA